MARRGGSRSRRRKAQNKPSTISIPSPARVRASSPVKLTVRRRVVDPGSLAPGRRVSDLPSVSSLRRQAGLPEKPSRDAFKPSRDVFSRPDAAASRKRRVSVNANVSAVRSAQLERKSGSLSGQAWRDNAAARSARDNRPDEKRPFECHPRPERIAKPVKVGGGAAPIKKFVNWCS